ncbi:MAG: hypothetical protein J5742_01445 [Alphaproteobacteria bacterium]|nr:hypothetical protein [Alphaproteobacteria bacterium]
MNNKQKILALAGLMAFVTTCKKPPIPEPTPVPPTPTDTITPIGDTIIPTPGDTITPTPNDTIIPTPEYDTIPGRKVEFWVTLDPYTSNHIYPSIDSLEYYAAHPGCDSIFIKWGISPGSTCSWTPSSFIYPRENLKIRFALSPKIFGGGLIRVNKDYGGASIPCEDSLTMTKLGMTACDSAWFADHGYLVRRSGAPLKSVIPPHYNGYRVLRADRSH